MEETIGQTAPKQPAEEKDEIPEEFDGIEIEEYVTSGGFASIYKGKKSINSYEKAVAVKIYSRQITHSHPDLIKEECEFYQTIANPHVPAYIAQGVIKTKDSQRHWLAMEWIDGVTLGTYAEENIGRLSPQQWLDLVEPIFKVLELAHNGQIGAPFAHCDISPRNILIEKNRDGRPWAWLVDFGIAKKLTPDNTRGRTVSESSTWVPGDFPYPEFYTKQARSSRTDVYSLGLILTLLLTGKMPYSEADIKREVMSRYRRPTPKSKGFDVGAWESVIEKALAIDPDNRYSSAGEFLKALKHKIPKSVKRDETYTTQRLAFIIGLISIAWAAWNFAAMDISWFRIGAFACEKQYLKLADLLYDKIGNNEKEQMASHCKHNAIVRYGSHFHSAETIISKANMELADRRYDESIKLANAAADVLPDQSWLIIGISSCKNQDVVAAEESYRHIVQNTRDREDLVTRCRDAGIIRYEEQPFASAKTILNLADNELTANHYEKARKMADALVEFGFSDTLRIIGTASCKMRDITRAEAVYRNVKLNDKDKEHIEIQCKKVGIVRVGNQSFATVESILKEAEDEYKKEHYDKARKLANEVVEFASNNALRIIGAASCRMKDINRAEDSYGKSSLNTTDKIYIEEQCLASAIIRWNNRFELANSIVSKANEALQGGNFEDARNYATALIEIMPQPALRIITTIYCHDEHKLGMAKQLYATLDNEGKKEARVSCEKAGSRAAFVGVSPEAPDTFIANALTAFIDKNYDQAIFLAGAVVNVTPNRAWRIIGASACRNRNLNLIASSYRKLDANGRQYLNYVCLPEGIELDGSSVKVINKGKVGK